MRNLILLTVTLFTFFICTSVVLAEPPQENPCNPSVNGDCPIPGLNEIFDTNPVKGKYDTLGDLITQGLRLVFILALFLSFGMLVFASLQWLFSGGNKESIAKARARITYAIVGLIVFILAITITQFIAKIFGFNSSDVPIPGVALVETAYAAPVNLRTEYAFAKYDTISDLISLILPYVFSIASIGVVFYFVYAAFSYIMAGGNKEGISKARGMMTHALIGLLLLLLSFVAIQFILDVLFDIQVSVLLFK
jgi:hypothetical protein